MMGGSKNPATNSMELEARNLAILEEMRQPSSSEHLVAE
jgi:hypothetical protein